MKTTQYQPKTGQRCHCKPGIQRDNCPTCEGTGWRIDFAAIRALGRERAIAREKAKLQAEYIQEQGRIDFNG